MGAQHSSQSSVSSVPEGEGEETEEKSFLDEGEKMVQRKKRQSSCVPAGKDTRRHMAEEVLEDRRRLQFLSELILSSSLLPESLSCQILVCSKG